MSLKRGYYMTDIHFGKKSNSSIHNQDCVDYIEWFCQQFRNDPNADYVAFLGDWHESRNAIDLSTLTYSYTAAKMLNQLGVPVYFVIGNHDMGMRHCRDVYSTIPFNEFENFTIIHEKPMVIDTIQDKVLFVPFLTKDEYPSLNQYTDIPLWAGHFEFKGFVLTGYSVKLEHGPDIDDFNQVGTILSGHFHRRQQRSNTIYIGNTFPMDFGDANDIDRGLAIHDHSNSNTTFVDWHDGPSYVKTKLSSIVDGDVTIPSNCHLDIDIDIEVSYQQLSALENNFRDQHKIRSLNLDESSKFILENTDDDQQENFHAISTNDMIIKLLKEADSEIFDNNLLIDIFREA